MRGKNKLKGRRASTIHIKTAEQHTNAIGMKGFFTRQWSRFSISNKSTASRTTSTVNNLDSISNVNDGADYSDSTFNTTASPSKNHHHELITNKSFVEGHRGHTNIKDMNRKSGCFPSLISEDSTSIPEIPIEQDFTSPKNSAEDDYSIIPEKPVLQCEDSDLECREDGSVKSMVNNFVGTVSSGSGEGKVPKTPMQSRSYGIDESAKGTLQFVPIGHAPSLDYTRGSFLVTNSGATSNNTSSRNDTRYRFSSFLSNAFSFDEGDGTTANTRRRSGFERQSISGKFAAKLQNFALHKILPIIDDPEFFTMTEQIILERSRSSDPIAEVDGTIISDVYLNPEEDGSMKV